MVCTFFFAPVSLFNGLLRPDASMKVSLPILERVYNLLQEQEERAANDEDIDLLLEPDDHLYFVDAFDMPPWHWSVERGTFEKCVISITHKHRYHI